MSDCCLSADLLTWLDDWGTGLNRKVDDASQEAWAACQVSVHRPQSKVPSMLRVGTDCSGIEAPIHALQGMGISHKHLWSSELEAAPRQVIVANTPPEEVFTDVISSSQGESPPFVQLYITGFFLQTVFHFASSDEAIGRARGQGVLCGGGPHTPGEAVMLRIGKCDGDQACGCASARHLDQQRAVQGHTLGNEPGRLRRACPAAQNLFSGRAEGCGPCLCSHTDQSLRTGLECSEE